MTSSAATPATVTIRDSDLKTLSILELRAQKIMADVTQRQRLDYIQGSVLSHFHFGVIL